MGSSGWPCIFIIEFRHPDEWISESQRMDRPKTVTLSIEGWWDGRIGSSLRRPSLRTDAPIPIHGSGAHKDPPWGTLLGCLDMASGARPILSRPCGHPDAGTRPSRRKGPPIPTQGPPIPTQGPAHPDAGTRPSRRRDPPIPTKRSSPDHDHGQGTLTPSLAIPFEPVGHFLKRCGYPDQGILDTPAPCPPDPMGWSAETDDRLRASLQREPRDLLPEGVPAHNGIRPCPLPGLVPVTSGCTDPSETKTERPRQKDQEDQDRKT